MTTLDESELRSAAVSAALESVRQQIRSDYNKYAEMVLRDEAGNAMRQAMIHRIWQLHILACWQAGKHPAILAPWAHGKTQQLVVGMTGYLLGQNTNYRIKIVCNVDDNATERLMGVSNLITDNKIYRWVFPHVRPVNRPLETRTQPSKKKTITGKWTQHDLYVARTGASIDPSVEAVGVLTSGIGGRADIIIFDDIVDQRNAINEPALRSKVTANFDNVWMSRLEPHGRVIYVGTPWHAEDTTHQLQKRRAWCVLKQYVSDDFKRIDQEVYNPFPGYPIPRFDEHIQTSVQRGRSMLGGGVIR